MENGRNAALNGGRGSGQTARRISEIYEDKIADLKANFDYVLEGKDLEIKELEMTDEYIIKTLESKVEKLQEDLRNKRISIKNKKAEIKELELELTVQKDQLQEEINLHLHAEEYIKSLEKEISILLSCKNCPENKGGYICEKEYNNKCLSQKIQCIKELQEENAKLKSIAEFQQSSNMKRGFEIQKLEQENNKLLDVINGQDVKIADLEQQMDKLKADIEQAIEDANRWKETETFSVLNRIYNDNFEITKGVSN